MSSINEIKKFADILESPNKRLRGLVENPFMRDAIEEQQQNAYWEKVDAYQKQRHILTDSEIETLLLEIDAGRNTFAELNKKVPRFDSPTLSFYLVNAPEYKYDVGIRLITSISRTIPYYFEFEEIP